MKIFGLVGFPLKHSFSKSYFTDKFSVGRVTDCEYRNFEIEDISMLKDRVLSIENLTGLNVTIPYKEAVLPYLDNISDEAQAIGAVNCIKIVNGELYGYNTDVDGFRTALLDLIGDARPSAIVLGTGGASKAVCYVLHKLGIIFRTVSREKNKADLTYSELNTEIISSVGLIINSTPLGTFPNVLSKPAIPYIALTKNHFLFDLVYNPPRTAFMGEGESRGATTSNGYTMLTGQAEKAWQIWNRTDK